MERKFPFSYVKYAQAKKRSKLLNATGSQQCSILSHTGLLSAKNKKFDICIRRWGGVTLKLQARVKVDVGLPHSPATVNLVKHGSGNGDMPGIGANFTVLEKDTK